MSDYAEEMRSWNEPMDAANRRAHFERNKNFNAFHDGVWDETTKAAIAKARDTMIENGLRYPNDL